MSTYVPIHAAGDGGWSWHLVEAELRARGHDVVAPDLPANDEALDLEDYADAVVGAVGQRQVQADAATIWRSSTETRATSAASSGSARGAKASRCIPVSSSPRTIAPRWNGCAGTAVSRREDSRSSAAAPRSA